MRTVFWRLLRGQNGDPAWLQISSTIFYGRGWDKYSGVILSIDCLMRMLWVVKKSIFKMVDFLVSCAGHDAHLGGVSPLLALSMGTMQECLP